MSRTDVPKLVPGPTMAEVAAEYDHRRAELKEAIAAERRAVVVRQHPPGRTPETQADIAAARAAPIGDGVAVTQDLDAALSNAELANTPAVREMGGPRRLDPRRPAQAVRGSIRAYHTASGNIGLDTTHTVGGLVRSLGGPPHIEIEHADLAEAIAALQALAGAPPRQPYPALDPTNLPPGSVLLTGNEAAHYRRLRDAARASQAAQNALATAGAELRDAFGALCKAIADGKVES